MKPDNKKFIQILLALIVLTAGIVLFMQNMAEVKTVSSPTPTSKETQAAIATTTATKIVIKTPAPSATQTKAFTSTATVQTIAYPVGPDEYPVGINPLNGLPVNDPESLKLPPALLSISNSPVTARPQAGLSFAPMIYEIFIGEGVTRFLTIFYGDLPKTKDNDNPEIGPIRSGRLAYEHVRKTLNGFIVMAYASDWVMTNLNYYKNLQSENPDDINGDRLRVDDLVELKQNFFEKLGEPNPVGLVFDPAVPKGGKNGHAIWLPFSFVDQVWWRYDNTSNTYHRWQDKENGQDITEQIDSLTGDPLEIENVVVIFADHIAYFETLIDLKLLYVTKQKALLFRDGQIFEGYWTTGGEEYEMKTGKLRPIRFLDKNGDPFPLKPGQTWVEIVTQETPVYESEDTENYYRLLHNRKPGSGAWVVQFARPEIIKTDQ